MLYRTFRILFRKCTTVKSHEIIMLVETYIFRSRHWPIVIKIDVWNEKHAIKSYFALISCNQISISGCINQPQKITDYYYYD